MGREGDDAEVVSEARGRLSALAGFQKSLTNAHHRGPGPR